jgi:hypothetical protein
MLSKPLERQLIEHEVTFDADAILCRNTRGSTNSARCIIAIIRDIAGVRMSIGKLYGEQLLAHAEIERRLPSENAPLERLDAPAMISGCFVPHVVTEFLETIRKTHSTIYDKFQDESHREKLLEWVFAITEQITPHTHNTRKV